VSTKADFTPEEWKAILEGPPTAGTMIVMAAKGGFFRETIAMAKAYTEARSQHGASELLDEIVSTKPHVDHTRFHSYEELQQHGVGTLRTAMTLLSSKASAQEVDDYRGFVLGLAKRVAEAHREHGVAISPAEETGLKDIEGALAAPTG
jgi:peptidyl-tRNA hydrolase